MLEANRFEHDADRKSMSARLDNVEFKEDANDNFVYHEDMETLIHDDEETVKDMISNFFNSQYERLKILEDYSMGSNYAVSNGRRRLEPEKSDRRTKHNWADYISTFITGYVISKPVTFNTKDDIELERLDEINQDNNVDSLNYELAYDTSRFGRAFELLQREDNKDVIYLINPKEIFVVRTADVSKKIIGAIHCPIYNGKVHLKIYTDKNVYSYDPFDKGNPALNGEKVKKHSYNDVPVVEWWNNRFRQGDFETEISLIDAYDASQSDTGNYMSDLNDALLVVSGDFAISGKGVQDFIDMKESNMLMLESGIAGTGQQTKVDAKYIYKQYDVQGTERYKDRLLNDLLVLSSVPNFNEEKFYSSSGIALQYRMIGLDQKRSTKENYYTQALKRRYRLLDNINRNLGEPILDISSLQITFHTNIPQDVWAEIKNYLDAGGDISLETLMGEASFIEDVQAEMERIDSEELDHVDEVKPDDIEQRLEKGTGDAGEVEEG